jgi:Domain of unknown function (DUF4124)
MRILVIIFCLHSSFVAANVYKCEQQNGEVVFTDTPCNSETKVIKAKAIQTPNGNTKTYPGFKTDQDSKMSEEERAKICAQMKSRYEETISSKCISVLNIDTGKTSCLEGKMLQSRIQRSRDDYEFACQI